MDLSGRVLSFLGKKDNVVHLFLFGAFVALGARSSAQQDDIDALEAEKESLRRSNKAMQKRIWGWHQSLFHLAESEPSSFPIPLSRLRAIYGEQEENAALSSNPSYSRDMSIQPEGRRYKKIPLRRQGLLSENVVQVVDRMNSIFTGESGA